MAIVYRNGLPYYYTKKKIKGKVRTTYIGSGEVAEVHHTLQQLENQRKAIEQQERKEEMEAIHELLTSEREIQKQFSQFMNEHGYYNHYGQWRKRPVKRNRKQGK